jgi:5-formyltetrahydrofolate cyclo-ligase
MNTDDNTVEARRALRRRLLAARAAIEPERRRGYDAAIGASLAEIDLLRQARTIAVYWPIRAEPDLAAAYAAWWMQGRVLALPVGGGPNGGLLFCRWDEGDEMASGPLGIMAPRERRPVLPDCLLIPCVGFTEHAGKPWRLGYGAGFYDRTLAHRPAPSVGVAYDESAASGQFVPNALDAPLTVLVTPSRVISSIAST